MSAQPAKRRKTSPAKATPILNRNVESATAPRASFMSPTRASLSRFNPALLPDARSASAGPAVRNMATPSGAAALTRQTMTPDQVFSKGQEAFNYIMGNFNAQMQQTLAAMTGQANSPSMLGQPAPGNVNMVPAVPLGEETDEQMEAMRAAIRARKQQERMGSARPESVARSTTMSVRQASEPSPTPTANPEEDDELSMEIPRREPARSRTGSARASLAPSSAVKAVLPARSSPQVVDEEMDELSPDMPRQNQRVQRLATEDDGLPDTPEQIRRQLEAQDHPPRGVLFSSPSKRRRTQTVPKKDREMPVPQPQPQLPEKQPPAEVPRTKVTPAPPPENSERVDPDLEAKKEEKSRLESELRKFSEEVRELERYAQAYTSATPNAPNDISPLIKLLSSSRTKDKPDVSVPALSALLTSFLPFSIPIAAPLASSESAKDEEALASHVPLKENDPLPLNSLFTPLTIESSTEPPVRVKNSDRLMQGHKITLSSPGSLLSCQLQLTVSSEPFIETAPTIDSLSIHDLSSWASAEIGPWLDERCKEGDIAAVGYGLGRYWDLSIKRAQCWIQCSKEFPHLLSLPNTEPAKAISELDPSALSSTATETKFSRRQLLPHLGRSQLVLESDDAILRISWKLQFDWTGEVESVVSAAVSLPESWHDADEDNALRKIPGTFDALMKDGGVMRAVTVVVGLLFDTQA